MSNWLFYFKILAQKLEVSRMNPANTTAAKAYKYFCLFVLILQNVSMVLSIRYSRMIFAEEKKNGIEKPHYLTSVVILYSEIVKFIVCNLIIYSQLGKYYFFQILKDPVFSTRYCLCFFLFGW